MRMAVQIVQRPEPNLAELKAAGCYLGPGFSCLSAEWRGPEESLCVFIEVQQRQKHAVSI